MELGIALSLSKGDKPPQGRFSGLRSGILERGRLAVQPCHE